MPPLGNDPGWLMYIDFDRLWAQLIARATR